MDIVGRTPPDRRPLGPLNTRLVLALLLVASAWALAEHALAATGRFQYMPDPALGSVRKPGRGRLTGLGPWAERAPGDLRLLFVGALGPTDAEAEVCRRVSERAPARLPGRRIAVAASFQRRHGLPQSLLLAEHLGPRLRPDLLVLVVGEWTVYDYAPPRGPAWRDELRRTVYASEVLQRVLFALYPNGRTGDFDEWPSEVLRRPSRRDLLASVTCPRALSRLRSRSDVVVLLWPRGVGENLRSYQQALQKARVPVAVLDDAAPATSAADRALDALAERAR